MSLPLLTLLIPCFAALAACPFVLPALDIILTPDAQQD